MATVESGIRFDRLRKLEQHLRSGKLGHQTFDFRLYNDAIEPICGTVGCAIGECPILWPSDWAFDEDGEPVLPAISGDDTSRSCRDWFGLENDAVSHLFHPDLQQTSRYGGVCLRGDATRYQVADNIAAFIEKMEPAHAH